MKKKETFKNLLDKKDAPDTLDVALLKVKECLPIENPIILEIGAANGYGTRAFLELFTDAKIFSFDADPRAIKVHSTEIQDERCTLIHKAVSNKVGKIKFYLSNKPSSDRKLSPSVVGPEFTKMCEIATDTLNELFPDRNKKSKTDGGWFYSSTLVKKKNKRKHMFWDREIEVDVTTVDFWCEENNIIHIDFLWVDVEGAEKDLIEGAKNSLAFTKFVLLEYGTQHMFPENAMSEEETIKFMEARDFELIWNNQSCLQNPGHWIGDVLFKNKNY